MAGKVLEPVQSNQIQISSLQSISLKSILILHNHFIPHRNSLYIYFFFRGTMLSSWQQNNIRRPIHLVIPNSFFPLRFNELTEMCSPVTVYTFQGRIHKILLMGSYPEPTASSQLLHINYSHIYILFSHVFSFERFIFC